MPLYLVTVTHSAYVQASSEAAARELSELIVDNELEPDVEARPVSTNELGWFRNSCIYTEDGSDMTVEEAFDQQK